ncbi:SF1B family DNA helicase RecD2 [Butyrivibrio sp. YAB3001]|uniref:SF1B family DNA helicase RecD2 n=1 Tax=Butyrivibrio sp. YAB3001 TaxID=1520812 RepID=UPI0008F67148|nr:ATP-dependent RecD-like DNA helicase [Butyrivibrio sp. YAB3001]SFC18174.1 exodeoxyribonuclease V alpha subunit [Butyrivibrio sp. YAB3001]
MTEVEKLKGYIEHFIFKNAENGYGVANLITADDEVVCTGNFKDAGIGDSLEMEGCYVNHPVYGMQFKISSFKITLPDDAASMQRYLGSGAIKGIGEKMAAKIVKEFGDDSFRIIEDEPEVLAEKIKGISHEKAIDFSLQMHEKRAMRDAMIFLQQYGISNTLAVKIFNQYGERVYAILKENPYQLADDISGVGFKTADEIASKVGISVDSEYRIKSGILYSLSQSSMDGNTFLPMEALIDKTVEILTNGTDTDIDAESIKIYIGNLIMDKKLVCKHDNEIYLSSYYYEEQGCAVMLEELNKMSLTPDEKEQEIRSKILDIEKKKCIELDELQRDAVLKSVTNGIVIITGGPGTGKTTTINTIINYYASEGMDIMLAAPTGRAAKRMTEATGYEARTIHRLLEVSGQVSDDNTSRSGVHFEKNKDNPLETDAIIIDEMSMVDIHLFYALLKALTVGTHLILVGDSSQLPSVGPGQVLSDLIKCGKFPTIILQKIFRQAEESDIVMNAHRIHNGEKPVIDNKSKDFFFLERNDCDVIYNHLILLIRDKLPGYVDAEPYDIQVLTPMRKGPLGVIQLNSVLQEKLNPPSSSKKEHVYGDLILREGDKVMQIKNNYQAQWEVVGKYNVVIDSGTGIFNGDMGIVREINEYSQDVVVEYDEHRRVRYHFNELEEIELAYAITIHKSQGSEYPAVVMPLLGGPRMLLNRNLLYTAVTRAKSTVCILGSSQTLFGMVDNEEQLKRYTGLKDRIVDVFEV